MMVNVDYIFASSCRLEGKAKTPAGEVEWMRHCRSISDEDAQRPPSESEVLHGNQQRRTTQSKSFIPFVRI
ncbi:MULTISPECIES: hypothetical protein [Priestia]|nr:MULTISPECIES: hypothetical protein [Priestia]UYO27940.1 hypothetical protein LDP77_04370 [Bacillus sp. T_4]MCI4620023.1 hypothetical protein [Priestia megaterium]MCM3094802.1 hypothetical protein [Priestia megaterium]MDD9795429.1 hypothetical protein [Priestia megaterium]MDP1382291.1 hypothetical protein [Priestia megaterium]